MVAAPALPRSASFFVAQTVDERTVDRKVTKERISEGGKRARLEEPEFSTAPSESNNDRFSRHGATLATHSVDHTVRRTATGGRASREVTSAGVQGRELSSISRDSQNSSFPRRIVILSGSKHHFSLSAESGTDFAKNPRGDFSLQSGLSWISLLSS